MFTHAIVRPPGATFAAGLTTQTLGAPDLALARAQHAAYVRALEAAGLAVLALDADDVHPDATFVEDTAVLSGRLAVVARPGAPERRGELDGMRRTLARTFAEVATIEAPGTLDGGDVCDAGEVVLVGLSARTDEVGARQLAAHLARQGRRTALVPLPAASGLLHLKSGLAWLGGRRLLCVDALSGLPALAGFDLVPVPRDEAYAANAVWLGDRVLAPAGFPRTHAALAALGLAVHALEMSEFRKMDGGLSCLSLRFARA